MKCSFIVSAFERPSHLACVLFSLKVQTEGDFEVIVTDNGTGTGNDVSVIIQCDRRFRYERVGLRDCYESANAGAKMAQGEYLCFPSDDNYYCPGFLDALLRDGQGADLIYSDCVYSGYGCRAEAMDVSPRLGRIDKGGFLIRRELFPGFRGPEGLDRPADGLLVEAVVAAGARAAKVPGFLWHHN